MAIDLIRGLYNIKPRHKECVLTVGSFDGVHRGHQALLAKLKEKAVQLKVPSLVLTFEPLPKEYFGQNNVVPRLTRWREKLTVIEASGIDNVLIIHFNEKMADFTAEEFVKNILYDALKIKHIIIGDDFRFGKARAGDFAFLKEISNQYHFTVEKMPSFLIDNQRVSSTLVREALASANHPLAEKLLGRPYTMQGRVVHGDKRGRIIGFPTANIYLHRSVTPVKGVYAVRMHGLKQQSLPGVANVGVRPTIDGTRSLLEVHLFDFDDDIYGRHVSVEFCKKIRDERRFESIDLLKQQIFKDADAARDYFNGEVKNL